MDLILNVRSGEVSALPLYHAKDNTETALEGKLGYTVSQSEVKATILAFSSLLCLCDMFLGRQRQQCR